METKPINPGVFFKTAINLVLMLDEEEECLYEM